MKKILMLVLVVGLFYGCASKEENLCQQTENLSEQFKKLYKDGKKKAIFPNMEIDLEKFVSSSKAEQDKKIYEIRKEQQSWFAQQGLYYDIDDCDDVKSEKITDQRLKIILKSLPPEIGKKILKGREEAKKSKKKSFKRKKDY